MEELLDRISQEGLLVVCIVLAVVALLLAILICYEIIVAKRKNKVTIEVKDDNANKSSSNELNIKYDDKITYVEENSDEDRIKAKEELEKIKNRLIAEDEEKKNEKKIEDKKQEEKKVEVAKQVETKVEIEKLEDDDDDLAGTKEYKVFTDLPEETKENIKLQIQQQIDGKVAEEKKAKEEKITVEVEPTPVVQEVKEEKVEVTTPEVKEIKEEPKEVPNEEVVKVFEEEDDNYTARRNDEVEIIPVVEDIPPVEPAVVEEKIEAPTYTARKDEEVAVETPLPVVNVEKTEEKQEEKKSEVKEDNIKLDAATKDYLIDEYLKQAILTRINEEKEKQLKLKEKIEKERRVLLFDDNIEINVPNEPVKEENAQKEIEKLEDDVEEVKEEKPEIKVPEVEFKPEVNKSSVYEELEEENAIISYDELVKATKFGYTDEEMNNYADEKDAIISIDELQKLFNEVNEVSKDVPTMDFSNVEFKKVEDLPKISDEKKFKKSDVISPVFGQVVDEKELELEKTQNLNKLAEEIKKTNEFLKTLKELQKNLD